MPRPTSIRVLAACVATLVAGFATAQQGDPATDEARARVGAERAGVHLVLVDAVVVDRAGRAQGDLQIDDFEVLVDHRIRTLDSLDVDCDIDSDAEPPVHTPRRLVIALDYQHLDEVRRMAVLDQLRHELTAVVEPGDEVMVAALTGNLRIEQDFTADLDEVGASLDRMAHDISLWAPDFRHGNEHGFTAGLGSLFEVLARVPGPKAVALYSTMQDVPLDAEFALLAARATAARCAVYPVDAAGLLDPLGEAQQRIDPG